MIRKFKKHRIILAFLSLTILINSSIYSQEKITALEIGDKVPDSLINIYKGKLVILDFWNKSCKVCIEAMPKLDSLQMEFNDHIQIVLVTENSAQEVNELFKKIKVKRPGLPIITSDSILNKLFPHNSVPHHVWIDKSGKVLFITEGYNATHENISKVLGEKKVEFATRKHFSDFDSKISILKEGNGRLLHHLNCYSVLMDYISEYGKSKMAIITDSLNKTNGLRLLNVSLFELIKIAFGNSIYGTGFDFTNRVIFEVANKSKFIWPSSASEISNWKHENVFSYESKIPIESKIDIYRLLQEDISRYLPYEVSFENRKVKCLVLTLVFSPNKINSKGGTAIYESDSILHIRNRTIQESLLVSLRVQNRGLAMPIIDSTNFSGKIDITIRSRLDEIDHLRTELRKYNLDLQEREIEIPMLVIKDKFSDKML